MSVVSMIVGATSPTGAKINTEVNSGANVRLATSTTGAFAGEEAYHATVTPDAQNVAIPTATGLAAGTHYYYRVEHGGTLDGTYTGEFTTHPTVGSVASFTLAVASCAGSAPDYPGVGSVLASSRISNHPVFDTIRALNPLMFFHCGDLHYYDLSSGSHGIAGGASLSNFRRAFSDVLLQTRQHELYRKIPSVLTWDDHCFLGNEKRGTEDAAGAANALTVYKERWPHYTLSNPTDNIGQSVQIGRVLVVVLDGRSKASANSATDNSSKTMLGSTQKTWLTNLLAGSSAEALLMMMGSQWTGTAHGDSWASFTTERSELLDILDDNGAWLDRMAVAYGDRHALRIIPGSQNEHGGFPVLLAGSLDSTPSSPVTVDQLDTPGRGQCGRIRVDDRGTAGITITLTGYMMSRPVMWHSFTTAGSTRIGSGPPSHVLSL
jgi:phosphodiesterase/alkaline phosphatase D-like protein